MVFYQPLSDMLPGNVSEAQCADRGLQVVDEIQKALIGPKRMIKLIIAVILATESIIVTATTATVALSQFV